MADIKAPKVTIASEAEEASNEAIATKAATVPAAAEEARRVSIEPPAEVEAPATEKKAKKPKETAPAVGSKKASEAAPAAPAVAEADAKPAREHRPFMAWLSENFPGHEHAVLGGFFGLCFAVLVFSVGVPKALAVLFFVVVGIIFGQYLDGDPRLVNAVRRLIGGDRP